MDNSKLQEEMKKRLDTALKARKKRDDAKLAVKAKEEAITKAKEAVKNAKSALKEAKENAEKLKDETEVILKLAGYAKETPTTRKAIGGFYFYKLINNFDTDGDGTPLGIGTFHKDYLKLKADDIGKAVLACSTYYADTDTVRIDGKKLRAKIAELLAKKDADIEEAKNLLDAEYAKLIPDDVQEEKQDKEK